MSAEIHTFHLSNVWNGNSDGDGTLTADWGAKLEYGVPADLGGKIGRSNPEEMLLAAAVSCFSITYALQVEKRRLPVTRIEVEAKASVERQPDHSLKFTTITLYPTITIDTEDEGKRQQALELTHRAESICLISKALSGNVEITVEPRLADAVAA